MTIENDGLLSCTSGVKYPLSFQNLYSRSSISDGAYVLASSFLIAFSYPFQIKTDKNGENRSIGLK
jgi:hypothetical protein